MDIFTRLAEQKIEESKKAGDLDNLPGSGLPLDLSEDTGVAEDFRMAYHILKNAGSPPPEIELFNEIQKMKLKLETDQNLSEADRLKLRKELSLKMAGLSVFRERLSKR